MTTKKNNAMELLAPAGTVAVFEAAVKEGADAVYIGAPWLNARALAKHFSMAEIAAMIQYAHKSGVKVYIAMNSLMKEGEADRVLELLAAFSALKADALIIQDLGVHYLAKRFFPQLRIHASTLLAAHNSLAVKHFAAVGFSRIVLARELTLPEISTIHRSVEAEIEVFVHGAMCFSYSGLCLFSSFLGGKSGLRGRCVQPCRRRYSLSGKGRGLRQGYFFSMNDLCAIEILPRLKEAGVSSLKIEGRMRSVHYVQSVVRAYRMVLDAPEGDTEVMEHAQELLGEAMGRKTIKGYFVSSSPQDILSPGHSGNIGLFLGKIKKYTRNRAEFAPKVAVTVGDRLRVHHEKTGERQSFRVKNLVVKGKEVASVQAGMFASLALPFTARPGDCLYKVDTPHIRGSASARGVSRAGTFQKKIARFKLQDRVAKIRNDLLREGITLTTNKETGFSPPGKTKRYKSRKKKGMELWLKIDDLRVLSHNFPVPVAKFVVSLERRTFKQFLQKGKSLSSFAKKIIWSLPPIILEEDVEFFQKAISRLLGKRYLFWQIGHVSQVQFFVKNGLPINNPNYFAKSNYIDSRITIIGDYTINALNGLALLGLKDIGVMKSQIAIETDRQNVKNILATKPIMEGGLTVYGHPPVFISRASQDWFSYRHSFVSPKGEKFLLHKAWGQTIAVPERTFSLLPWLSDLAEMGVRFAVIDLCRQSLSRNQIARIFEKITKPRKTTKDSTFNFFHTLQ